MERAIRARRCETCAAWSARPDDEDGECHRHAPRPPDVTRPDDMEGVGVTDWPRTMCDDFCGEWLPLAAVEWEPEPD